MWSVPPPPADVVSQQLEEATSVQYLTSLDDTLLELFKAYPEGIIHTLPASPLFPQIQPNTLKVANSSGTVSDAYLLSALHKARLVKTEHEITQIRKANEISSRAHEVVMRVLGKAVRGLIQREAGAAIERPLLPGEWLIEKEAEAEAIFVASCRREG